MYDDRFFPFYTAYANPVFYGGEQIQEQEFALSSPIIQRRQTGSGKK